MINLSITSVTKQTNNMKYLRIKPFKELQSADDSGSDSDKIETKLIGSKRCCDDDLGIQGCDKRPKIESESEPCPPLPSEAGGSSVRGRERLSSVQVLGHELLYKQHAASVLFMKTSIMELLTEKMPCDNTPPLDSVINSTKTSAEEGKVAFISWSKIKSVLHGGLLDLSIREALLKETSPDHDRDNDNIILGDDKVKFKVKNGVVYLEVLSAFASIGRLHEALSGKWADVDSALSHAGVSLKAAFKRKAVGESSSSGPGTVSRNFITFTAFSLLCKNTKMKCSLNKLAGTVERIKEQEERVCTEIQQTVNMILRTSRILPGTPGPEEDATCSAAGSWTVEQKHCDNSLCGRGYHFVSKCCSKNHSLTLCDETIGYVRKNGKIYLEKCSTFALIGRMYVIRCSDYKKVDTILLRASSKDDIGEFFMFEKEGMSRNLRTHIALDAFILLLEAGFDAFGREDLLKTTLQLRDVYQAPRRDSCEDFETIDLSSSEVETEAEEKVKESSSGIDSEDFSPMISRRRLKSFNDYDSDDDSNIETSLPTPITDLVEMLGVQIPVQIFNEKIFVDKNALIKISCQPLQHAIKNIDKILNGDPVLEDALLYQGRQKMFLSVAALHKLVESEEIGYFDAKNSLTEEISEIMKSFTAEKSQILSLPSFGDIKYKIVNGIIYLETVKVLTRAGFSAAYFQQPLTKANMFLCRVLAERGVNTNNSFCKHGKSKYSFISLAAISVLLRSDIGNLKDNDKSSHLVEEIMETIESHNITQKGGDKHEMTIKVLEGFPPIKYKILDGKLFLHRKSSFEILDLESSVLNNRKGYMALNNILKQSCLSVEESYLGSRQQRYCYISCLALTTLLQSQDPLIVCLANKDSFLAGMLAVLQTAATTVLDIGEAKPVMLELDNEESIEMISKDKTVYLEKVAVLRISGLEDSFSKFEDSLVSLEERGLDSARAFLPRGEAACGWISLHCLYLLMSFTISELNINKVAWRDILSAVALYQPKIQAKLRLQSIKTKLFEKFEVFFVEHSSVLAEKNSLGLMECEEWPQDQALSSRELSLSSTELSLPSTELSLPVSHRCLELVARVSSDQRVPGSGPSSPQPPSTLHSPCLPAHASPEWTPAPSAGHCPLTSARFTQLRKDILAQADSLGKEDNSLAIGDWRLDTVEEEQLKLSVRSGYGASRKNSFLHPDFAAILRYNLVLSPSSLSLSINERSVDSEVIATILAKTESEGSLSFLVQLISLRPCFGSFSPELVETVSQSIARDSVPDKFKSVFIDNKFIGTSSCGRTYAGTVRHQECRVLAVDRVSDTCSKCRGLASLPINRSLLAQEESQESVKDRGQKSVWELATTSKDSCSFVCPQVQSFNTSLPHAFDGRAQASTIVSHKVEIANNLNVQVLTHSHINILFFFRSYLCS